MLTTTLLLLAVQAQNLRGLDHVSLSVTADSPGATEVIERYARRVIPSTLLVSGKSASASVPVLRVVLLDEHTDWKLFTVQVKLWERLQIPRNREVVSAETWTAMFGDQSELLPIGSYHDESKAMEWARKAIDQFVADWRKSNEALSRSRP